MGTPAGCSAKRGWAAHLMVYRALGISGFITVPVYISLRIKLVRGISFSL